MLSAFVTFVVLADLTPMTPTHKVVVTLLLINALTVFLLVGIIAHEVWVVVQARRRGRAAARLHAPDCRAFIQYGHTPRPSAASDARVELSQSG